MQPTMKLRLLKNYGFIKGDPFLTDSYGNYYRLQQWWVGDVWKENESSPSEIFGEWRDIPIEVEE